MSNKINKLHPLDMNRLLYQIKHTLFSRAYFSKRWPHITSPKRVQQLQGTALIENMFSAQENKRIKLKNKMCEFKVFGKKTKF